ncbi:MAG: hypothetical protein AB1706_17115 [Pseudomonadota bacterium]
MAKDVNIGMKILATDAQAVEKLDQLIVLLNKIEGAGGKVKVGFDGASVAVQQLANTEKQLGVEQQKLINESLQLKKHLQDSRNNATQFKSALQQLKNEHTQAKNEAARHKKELEQLKQEMSETKRQSSELGNSFKQLAGLISFTAVVAGLAYVAKAAMDATEAENLFAVSMGNMGNEARKWSDQVANKLGLDVIELRKNLGTLNVMLEGMNFNNKEALQMSESLTKLAYDLSSFFNISPEQAFEKIRSGIIGESEPLRTLGVIITETTVKNALLTHGIKTQGKELTEQEKVLGRYLVIMDSTRAAQGDLERTGTSTTNMLRRMQAQANVLARETGQYLTPAIDELVKNLLYLIQNARTFIQNEGPQLAQIFQGLAATITTLFNSMNQADFSPLIGGLKLVTAALLTIAGGAEIAIKSLQLLSMAAQGAIVQSPEEAYKTYLHERLAQLRKGVPSKPQGQQTTADKKFAEATYNQAQTEAKRLQAAGYFDKISKQYKDKTVDKQITSIWEAANSLQDNLNKLSAPPKPFKPAQFPNINIPSLGGINQPTSGKKAKTTDTEREIGEWSKKLLQAQLEEKFKNELSAGGLSIQIPLTLLPKVNEGSFKQLGLSEETVSREFKQVFDRLQDLRRNYNKQIEQENQRQTEIIRQAKEKQAAIEEKYLQDRAKQKAQLQVDLMNATLGEGSGVQKAELLNTINQQAKLDEKKIDEEYNRDVLKLSAETSQQIVNLKRDQNEKIAELHRQETELLNNELDKQKQMREELEKDNQEQIVATAAMKEETLIRRQLLAAKVSQDEIAQIELEYKLSENSIQKEIQLINLKTAARLKELDALIQIQRENMTLVSDPGKLAEYQKNIEALEKEKILINKNGNEEVLSLNQTLHEKTMDMIEKENQAYADQFEKRLGYMEKILGLAGKFMGKDNIASKVAGYIGEYKGILGDFFKFFKSSSTAQQGGSLQTLQATISKSASSGMTALESIGQTLTPKDIKNVGPGFEAMSDLGKLWKQSWGGKSTGTATAKAGATKGGWRSIFGLGQANPVQGSIMGALTGGLTGYSMGQEQGALGILGGTAAGAMTGGMIGGGLGALIGGGVGLVGGLLGWLFGGRTRKEMKRLNYVTAQSQAGIANASAQINSASSMAQRAKLMNELTEAKSRSDNAMSAVLQQESYMLTELNPANFKSKKARREAAQAQSDMAQKVFEQKMAAEELQRQVQEAIRQRQAIIEEQERSLYAENFSLYGQSFADPLRNNAEGALARQMDSNNKYTGIVRDFADSPTALKLAAENRLREMKILQRQGELETVDTGAKEVQFYSEARQEHLKATDAGSVASLQEEKQAALEQLRFDQQKLMIEYADNQNAMTAIAQMGVDKRKNIEKEYNEEIRDEYQKTAQTLADLLSKRDEIAGQFDFKRAKSRTDIIKEQLEPVDKEIRAQWPEAINNLKGLTPDVLAGMKPDQLASIQKEIQSISNFSASKAFNNVININVPAGTTGETINAIGTSIKTLLDNQARLPA